MARFKKDYEIFNDSNENITKSIIYNSNDIYLYIDISSIEAEKQINFNQR